jgi:hypothetical protein
MDENKKKSIKKVLVVLWPVTQIRIQEERVGREMKKKQIYRATDK